VYKEVLKSCQELLPNVSHYGSIACLDSMPKSQNVEKSRIGTD